MTAADIFDDFFVGSNSIDKNDCAHLILAYNLIPGNIQHLDITMKPGIIMMVDFTISASREQILVSRMEFLARIGAFESLHNSMKAAEKAYSELESRFYNSMFGAH